MTTHELNLIKENHGSLILLAIFSAIALIVLIITLIALIRKGFINPKKLYDKILKKPMEVPVPKSEIEDFDKMEKDTTNKIFRKILSSLNEDGWKREISSGDDRKKISFKIFKKEEGLESELTVYIFYTLNKSAATPTEILIYARITNNGYNSFEEKTTDPHLLSSVSKLLNNILDEQKLLNNILDEQKNKTKKAYVNKLKKIESSIDLTFKGLDTTIKRDEKLENLLNKKQ